LNTRRQTVWLVSMLGLMVVLSAYYLFTDNVDDLNVADNGSYSDVQVDMTDPSSDHSDDVLHLSEGLWEEWKTDEEILEEYEAKETSAFDYFTSLHLERMEKFAEQIENQMEIINDASSTDSAIQMALEEYNRLEELQSKLIDVEEQLMSEFENVYISEEEGAWKVIVKADHLEASQAVSIIDLVSDALDVKAASIQVQYRN
jgi:stage III sporulation protein AH